MLIHTPPVTLDLSVAAMNTLWVLKIELGRQNLLFRVLQFNLHQRNIKSVWARMEWKTPNLNWCVTNASLKLQVVCYWKGTSDWPNQKLTPWWQLVATPVPWREASLPGPEWRPETLPAHLSQTTPVNAAAFFNVLVFVRLEQLTFSSSPSSYFTVFLLFLLPIPKKFESLHPCLHHILKGPVERLITFQEVRIAVLLDGE